MIVVDCDRDKEIQCDCREEFGTVPQVQRHLFETAAEEYIFRVEYWLSENSEKINKGEKVESLVIENGPSKEIWYFIPD